MKLLPILATVCFALVAVSASAQSLAEASAAAKQAPHAWPLSTADSAKTYTNADLRDAGGSLNLTTTYDRMKDFTTITLDKMPLSPGLDLEAFGVFHGHEIAGADASARAVTFSFMFSGTNWKYLTYHPLSLLLDNAIRVDVGAPDHHGTVGNGYVLEQMTLQIGARQLQQIVAAKTVEGELGLTMFTLTAAQRDGLRALSKRMGL